MNGATKPTKQSRREHARAVAQRERDAARRRERRYRILGQGGIILGTLGIVGIIALVVSSTAPATGPGPRNMASGGILVSESAGTVAPQTTPPIASDETPVATDAGEHPDTANIVVYLDFACPACRAFEQTNSDQIASWVAAGEVTLEVHPIAILDNMSLGKKYSSRAANAAACVADQDPDRFLDAAASLFAHQPAEGTEGPTDAALAEVISGAGVEGKGLLSCITDRTFIPWIAANTKRATTGPLANTEVASVTGTPTVLVNGIQYLGSITDARQFAAFIDTATK